MRKGVATKSTKSTKKIKEMGNKRIGSRLRRSRGGAWREGKMRVGEMAHAEALRR